MFRFVVVASQCGALQSHPKDFCWVSTDCTWWLPILSIILPTHDHFWLAFDSEYSWSAPPVLQRPTWCQHLKWNAQWWWTLSDIISMHHAILIFFNLNLNCLLAIFVLAFFNTSRTNNRNRISRQFSSFICQSVVWKKGLPQKPVHVLCSYLKSAFFFNLLCLCIMMGCPHFWKCHKISALWGYLLLYNYIFTLPVHYFPVYWLMSVLLRISFFLMSFLVLRLLREIQVALPG